MAANLSAPPIKGEMWALADWVEFKALCNEFSACRLKEIIRISDEEQEEENKDFAEQDSSNEQLLEALLGVLAERQSLLKESYPFTLDADEIIVTPAPTQGGYAYLYCLFFSHIGRTDVINNSPPSSNKDRDLMQVCSTFAIAGFINGNAISFGFPRPDHSNFLTALRRAYGLIGEGVVRDKLLPGASRHEKDGEMDVIAWSASTDGTPGVQYWLGQVATGLTNWDNKSVKGAIDPFHDIWFSVKPPSTPNPAMFIPFCLDQGGHNLSDVVKTNMYKFGKIFFRYNIPNLVDVSFSLLAENPDLHIERQEDFQYVIDYVEEFRSSILA